MSNARPFISTSRKVSPQTAAYLAKRTFRNEKTATWVDRLLATHDAYNVAKQVYLAWSVSHRYEVRVSSEDRIYNLVHTWYLEHLSSEDRRSVLLQSERGDGDDDDMIYNGPPVVNGRRIVPRSDDRRVRTFMLEGFRVEAWIDRGDGAHANENGYIQRDPDSIIFATRTLEGQQAIFRQVAKIAASYGGRRIPTVHVMSNYGSWNTRSDLPLRPLDSVILRDGLRDEILDDMQRFLAQEQRYIDGGMPWHRGYLFHGPPGNGKTSIVRGLAAELGIDVWYASLGDLTKDTNLIQLLSSVPSRSILLLEDIDVLSASHDREGEPGQVSLSGLLNALDGVATPHGLITVMTTNEVDNLDDALRRPGRSDMTVLIDLPDQDQANRMFERFYGQPPASDVRLDNGSGGWMSAADLYEQFKQHMDDPDGVALYETKPQRNQRVQDFINGITHNTLAYVDMLAENDDPRSSPQMEP